MKTVYDLATELYADPEQVEAAQALTLNVSKPHMGLKGTHGLFGSADWWASVRAGDMPTREVTGTIERAYYAGQGGSGPPNAIDLRSADGGLEMVGIYLNDPRDVVLFQVGKQARVLYALGELKSQPGPDGKTNYSKIALEMAVSAD